MAEFCLDCWNKLNETNHSERKYILSDYLDLCEGCGKWKSVIITERKAHYMYKFRYFVLPFKMVYVMWRLLILPYLIFEYKKAQKKNNL